MLSPKIVVAGSSNTDMVAKVSRLPKPGETLLGGEFLTAPGGKGANQAVAAARLGGEVTFIAKLGTDSLGDQAVANFETEGIDTRYVFRDRDARSGVALIFVDDQGENMIVVAPGANARLLRLDIDRAKEAIEQASILITQLEVPTETVEHALSIAYAQGVPTILNPAPGQGLRSALLTKVTYLTPNETEATALTGLEVQSEASAAEAGRRLVGMGVKHVIVTRGRHGAMLTTKDEVKVIPSREVDAVDTTAAGDAFNGALAFALATKMRLEEAVGFANRVGALSVTRMGAQPSMPTIQEVQAFV